MRVELENVVLDISGRAKGFAEISFVIESGIKFMVGGPSGCGKSTLLKTICGLLQPKSGNIRFDGVSSTSTVSYCPQFPVLFPVGLMQNVLCGRDEHAVRERAIELTGRFGMNEICDELCMGESVNMPRSRDVKQSGGQAQRIGIIRTFLDPSADLLIFDEPTSALDSGNEQIFSELLREDSRTAIVVSHSKALADRMDGFYEIKG